MTLGKRAETLEKVKAIEKMLPSKKKRMTRTAWYIAASVILILGIGLLLISRSNDSEYDTLYASHYKLYPNTVFNITRSDTTSSTERKAFEAYQDGNMELAANYFKTLKTSQRPEYINFYLGQVYLNKNSYADAIDYFNSSIHEDHYLEGESYWYLALASLKLGDIKKAKDHLTELTTNYSYMNEEAKLLLENL